MSPTRAVIVSLLLLTPGIAGCLDAEDSTPQASHAAEWTLQGELRTNGTMQTVGGLDWAPCECSHTGPDGEQHEAIYVTLKGYGETGPLVLANETLEPLGTVDPDLGTIFPFEDPFRVVDRYPWIMPAALDWQSIQKPTTVEKFGMEATVRPSPSGFTLEAPFSFHYSGPEHVDMRISWRFEMPANGSIPETVNRGTHTNDAPPGYTTIWAQGQGEVPTTVPRPTETIWDPVVEPVDHEPGGVPPERAEMPFPMSRAVEVARAQSGDVDAFLADHEDAFVSQAMRQVANVSTPVDVQRHWEITYRAPEGFLEFTVTQNAEAMLLPAQDELYSVSGVHENRSVENVVPTGTAPMAPSTDTFQACQERLGHRPAVFTFRDLGYRVSLGGYGAMFGLYTCDELRIQPFSGTLFGEPDSSKGSDESNHELPRMPGALAPFPASPSPIPGPVS